MDRLVIDIAVLVLSGFIGFAVISKVPNTLHTPLMSGTNAIHGIVILGGLLVLGLVIVVGAARSKDGVMRFSRRLPKDTATLLQVTVFIIVLLGLSLGSHDPASHHVKSISIVGAICLLVVYLTWAVPYLRADVSPVEGPGDRAQVGANPDAAGGGAPAAAGFSPAFGGNDTTRRKARFSRR